MKIHIIGPSGSGKTFFAKQLSAKYDIPFYSLDNLFWDNSCEAYNVRRDAVMRGQMLETILQQDSWIIEGVQHAWVDACFAEADIIYLLETPALLCRFRIVRRFVERKCSRTGRKNETLKSLVELLRWTKKFYAVNLPEIQEKLRPYSGKTVRVCGKKEGKALIR